MSTFQSIRSKLLRHKTLVTIILVSIMVVLSFAFINQQSDISTNDKVSDKPPKANSGWLAGDFHEHTHFTDGGYAMDSLFQRGFIEYGLSFMANSEHGGTSDQNFDGTYWEDVPGVVFKGIHAGERDGKRLMWRWQTLLEYSYPRVDDQRELYKNKHLFQGLEWNSPVTSHTSTGIVSDNGLPISSFEYMFDSGDKDTLGGPAQNLHKHNGRDHNGNGEHMHDDQRTKATVAAVAWMAKNHRYTSYAIPAHPERGGDVSIADLRNMNNAGPDVAFGIEAAPGHQKSTRRGAYRPTSMGSDTYGGWGYMASRIGGLWDALLGEGRHFWVFANSDFHGTKSDFWPGEYQKNWVFVEDISSQESIVNGMRSGNVFVAHGDIIDSLDFKIIAKKGKTATMGQELKSKKGETLKVQIRFRSPEQNHNGDSHQVRMVQLIMGEVTGIVEPGSSDYNKPTNESTRMVKLFTSEDWTTTNGWTNIAYELPKITKDSYIRIRGTNHNPGTEFETDNQGNPLPDSLANNLNLDGAEEAWADLWFYSNPIFVDIQ